MRHPLTRFLLAAFFWVVALFALVGWAVFFIAWWVPGLTPDERMELIILSGFGWVILILAGV